MLRVRHSLLLATLVATPACASFSYEPTVAPVGDFRELEAEQEKAEALTQAEAANVRAIADSLPEGMQLESGALKVDPARYEIVGKVSAEPNSAGAANLGLWFYPYAENESWRKGYCYWQVPLSWVTLTVWAWFTPFHYPCKVSAGDVAERRRAIVSSLQRAAMAMGADTVVFGFGGLTVVNAHTGAVLDTAEAFRGEGFAVRSVNAAPVQPVQTSLPRPIEVSLSETPRERAPTSSADL